MDFTLRCNTLTCRTQLKERAIVTTCSHIFCPQCSDQLGLTRPTAARICPACNAQLTNPDDAALSMLEPTEDYKTSVLSGMSPTVIMECASRGLAFYTYQATQEVIYQEYLAKSLTDKYGTLSASMDKLIRDANAVIEGLRKDIQGLQDTKKELQEKCRQLEDAFSLKTRAHSETQKLYHQLTGQVQRSATATAASQNAEHVAQTASGLRYEDRYNMGGGPRNVQYSADPILGAQPHFRQRSEGSGGSGGNNPRIGSQVHHGLWAARGNYNLQNASGTPSHRQQLPLSNAARGGSGFASSFGTNAFAGNGYGLSSGVRVGKQPGGPSGASPHQRGYMG